MIDLPEWTDEQKAWFARVIAFSPEPLTTTVTDVEKLLKHVAYLQAEIVRVSALLEQYD